MKTLNKELLKEKIEFLAQSELADNKMFGSSYCVYQDGETVYKNHFGYCDVQGKNPVNDKTMYRIASMTKPVTAAAVMKAVEKYGLSIEDKVSKFFPEFSKIHVITPEGEDLGIVKNDITIKHLLTHTSGFGCLKPDNMKPCQYENRENTIKFFFDQGLSFEPFTKQAYSGYGAFEIVSAVMEKVTGCDFAEFVQKEILEPCKMVDTTFAPDEDKWSRMITMHNKVDEKSVVGTTYEKCVFGYFPCHHTIAGAGLASTLGDYVNFAKMLLDDGYFEGYQVLSAQSVAMIRKPHVPIEFKPGNENWGLGVRVIVKEEYKRLPVGTYGWSGAYGSHFWVDPINKICAVFMKNSRFDGGAGNRSAVAFEQVVFESLM